MIPDEVIRYALGRFGKPNVPIDPEGDGAHRVAAAHARAARRSRRWRRCRSCAGASARSLSDEEFLLRATMPGGLVDAMRAAGPAARHYDPATQAGDGAAAPTAGAPRPRRSRRGEAGLPAGIAAQRAERDETHERRDATARVAEAPFPKLGGFMFDVDGTLLLSDRSLGGYEVLPGAVETLNDAARARRALSCC